MESRLEWKDATPEDAAEAFRQLGDALDSKLVPAMEEVALRIEREAALLAPVDTGRLRASINNEVEKAARLIIRARIGSNVSYAPFQELDNPYLRPAIEQVMPKAEQILTEAVEAAWDEVSL